MNYFIDWTNYKFHLYVYIIYLFLKEKKEKLNVKKIKILGLN